MESRGLTLHTSAAKDAPPDPALEVARLETLLEEKRAELNALQEGLRAFKSRYAQVVGSRLAELAEVERAVREAERRVLGVAAETEDEGAAEDDAGGAEAENGRRGPLSLRKLFWSVAKVFHPDHASDEREARRRHAIMAEASRAYTEGDVESLHTLLADEELQSYCAIPHDRDDTEDPVARLLALKEELRTVEFGLKRLRQDRLFQLKLAVEAEALRGRDKLAEEAERIERLIAKARRRLEHFS
ncbi:MAG TPA: hypothetical protein VEQ42_13115 [Pyrinomonadaceae bacterium]|nr:hypothetical protein [Pyrinomonadaceae bacterium]